jgi:hypothetical protein
VPAHLNITGEIARLFQDVGRIPPHVSAEATNNLPYILRLMEYGWSRQLPTGWMRRRQRHHEELLRREVDHALAVIMDNPIRAVVGGVSMAALAITRDLADHTPVDTGRAKGAWVARLPNGQRFEIGPTITPAQQRSIRRRRRRET